MNLWADILSASLGGILPPERRGKDAPRTGRLGSLPHLAAVQGPNAQPRRSADWQSFLTYSLSFENQSLVSQW
jgi:hypothetical protein